MQSLPEDQIAVVPTERTTAHFLFGKQKTFVGLQRVEWAFLITSLINIAVCSGMTIYSLVQVLHNNRTSPDATLAVLLLINCVFCVFYVVYGVRTEREYELYVFIGAILVIVIYCILEYSLNVKHRTTVKLARMIMSCVLGLVNGVLAVLVAREFGWLEFRIVGASEALQLMYRDAARYSSFLKFDLQVIVNLVLLALVNGLVATTAEKITLGVGLPLSVLLAVLGWLSVRREWRWGMIVFCIVGLVVPAYAVYTIYHSYEVQPKSPTATLLYASMAAASFSLIIRGFIYIEAWRVYHNFGKGLMERAFEVEDNERTSLLAVPRRR